MIHYSFLSNQTDKKREIIMSEAKTIKAAVIGLGSRGRNVFNNLLRDSNRQVVPVAAYDPDPAVMRETIDIWGSSDVTKPCTSYQEAINTPGVEWVMVFSPNVNHKEHIISAFKAGKNVFSEKPLATTIEDCRAIYEAYKASGKLFATGFVLRYASIYRKVKEILSSGKLGYIIAIEANENIMPDHGGYIMCNWRRHTSQAGPHILEKCCHDLDLINWFCESLPTKVASFGGRNFFIPANRKLEEKYGVKRFKNWWDPHATETPFSGDTDLMDNTVAVIEYRNQIRVTFMATMSNIIPERRMYFSCSEGNLRLDLYSQKLEVRKLGDEGVLKLDIPGDGHGGGDDHIMKELYESMTTGALPKCSGDEGLQSAVLALAIDQAAKSGSVVDLEPIWKSFNR